MNKSRFLSGIAGSTFACLLSAAMAILLCACDEDPGNYGSTGSGNSSNTSSSGDNKYEPIPEEAMTFWQDEAPVDPSYYEGRYYALAKGAPAGHWECTDKQLIMSGDNEYSDGSLSIKVVPKETDDEYDYDDGVFYFEGSGGKSRISAFAMFMSSSYNAGEECAPTICFEYDPKSDSAPGKLYGAAYFADVKPGDDIFGHSISVREYFTPRHGKKNGYIRMRGYGKGTINSHNYAKKSDGGGEMSTDSSACFPCFVAEGDKIWVVVDVMDGEAWKVGMRKLAEYTWVLDPDKPAYGMEEQVEETHEESDPEWTKNEYAGRWDLTGVRFVNSDKSSGEKNGAKVTVNRYGVDGQNLSFEFEAPGQKDEILFPFLLPAGQYGLNFYAGDNLYDTVRIYPSSAENQKNELLSCLYAICDVENEDSPSDLKITPKYYFPTQYPKKGIKSFSPYPQGDTMRWTERSMTAELNLEGSFPEGETDGEKISMVIGASDVITGECSLYNIFEYTYSKGPFVVWDYNPPGY
ncbi:MAG: hypothetical protein K6E91_03450 [Butyrivibrio sp.]|nr:hypothetical protein [Butyrivibrio sp.]